MNTKNIAKHLTDELFKIGDFDQNCKTWRMQFMVGNSNDEYGAGGMCHEVMIRFFENQLAEYRNGLKEELISIVEDSNYWAPTQMGICLECERWTPPAHPEAHDHLDECKAVEEQYRRRDWKTRLENLLEKLNAN